MGGTLWRKIGAPGANITENSGITMQCAAIICWTPATEGSETEISAYLMNQNEKSEFPARLRKLREERRQSRVVVSELCGLSRGMIRQYERGEKIPTLKTAMILANHFGVSIDYLAGETNIRKRSL